MESPIQAANDHVPMATVCSMAGVDIPDWIPSGRSFKTFCPFGDVSHADGGYEAAMRVYPDTNSAWCFAGCGWFGPVKLLAMVRDISQEDAAHELLQLIGWRPQDPVEAMEAAAAHHLPVDQSSLAEALKMYCSRIDPHWESRQFDDTVSAALTRCLELLPRVREDHEAEKWLVSTKAYMADALATPVAALTKGS